MSSESIEPFARSLAASVARGLAEASGLEITADEVTLAALAPTTWSARTLPLVAVALPCTAPAVGESLVTLAPESARALVVALTPAEPIESDELDEAALAAIARAVDSIYADASGALTLAPSTARLLTEAPEDDPGAWALSFTLQGDALSLEIVQTIPVVLAEALAPAQTATPEQEPEQDAPAAAPPAADSIDLTRIGVERAAAIAADATAEVLTALFSEELSAATPVVEPIVGDPLEAFEYPLIVAEVAYLSGLEGSNRFVLLPADAAQLAAAMMGTPETTGDGLSAIEQSAVSEAMNQVMSATADELSKALGVAVEAAPPTCIVIDTPEQARESIGSSSFRASFRIVSTIFGAEIVQLVSPELAASLAAAFASFALSQEGADALDDAFGAFADMPLSGFAGAMPEPPDPRGGARELLSGIRVRVSAELGRSRLPISRVANMPAGSIVVLDRAPTDPVDVLVNGTPFAQARVVLVDGEYAVQIVSLTPLELNG